jgi:hypothetical protein
LPAGLDEIMRTNWDKQLNDKKQQLIQQGLSVEIKPYHLDKSEKPLNALYEGKSPKMWPGPVVTLKDAKYSQNSAELSVGQMFYPLIAALKDPEIVALFAKEKIDVPRPALGICTLGKTIDDELTLTVRGAKTNVYPGRFYTMGGNPTTAEQTVVEHQKEEIQDEILVKQTEYNPAEFMFGGIVNDTDLLKNKPDLVGWISLNLYSDEIRERVHNRPVEKRPTDVYDVAFVSAYDGTLFDYLVKMTSPIQYCPPVHGALALYGAHNFGQQWLEDLIQRLE